MATAAPRARPPSTASRAKGAGVRLRVGILLTHNFTLTAFSTFVDVLRLSADEGDRSRPIGCQWHIMSAHRRPIASSCGVRVEPTSGLIAPSALDYIVVVGGLLHHAPPIPKEIARYLRDAAAIGARLVGLCTGSFVLCRLGLMEGRKCCVSWFHYRDFIGEFPHLVPVADQLYVIDRDRITCSGGVGVADLAARLVSEHLSAAQAQKALHIMQIGRLRPETSAQPAPVPSLDPEDNRVARALLLMEQNLSEPVPIAVIAARLAMSARQLERMFRQRLGRSPRESYMEIRVRNAKWMLAKTDLSTASIAAELGFVDAAHLSRSFKARTGLTPSAFRAGVSDRPEDGTGTPAARAEPNGDRRVFE